jgi:hypothetical protein
MHKEGICFPHPQAKTNAEAPMEELLEAKQ